MAGIPDEVKALAELSPIEDIVLYLLRAGLPEEIRVQSLISVHQEFPMVMPRRMANFGDWGGDPRFTDRALIALHVFVEDPNGDEDAAILSEACRVVLRNAWLDNTVVPDRGHLINIELTSAPRRVADYTTSSGPVQYADLPTGVWRYESIYRIAVRKPRSTPYPIPTP